MPSLPDSPDLVRPHKIYTQCRPRAGHRGKIANPGFKTKTHGENDNGRRPGNEIGDAELRQRSLVQSRKQRFMVRVLQSPESRVQSGYSSGAIYGNKHPKSVLSCPVQYCTPYAEALGTRMASPFRAARLARLNPCWGPRGSLASRRHMDHFDIVDPPTQPQPQHIPGGWGPFCRPSRSQYYVASPQNKSSTHLLTSVP